MRVRFAGGRRFAARGTPLDWLVDVSFFVAGFVLLSLTGCARATGQGAAVVPEASQGSPAQAASDVARGREIFLDTPRAARAFVPVSTLRCASCHTHEGRTDNALPLNGAHRRYPTYMAREAKTCTIADRVRECFARSLNGVGPSDDSDVMRGLLAYIASLPENVAAAPSTIAIDRRRPLAGLSQARGRALFEARCTACHGRNGQGVGAFPPLWGDRAYNDGAGLAQIYKLAAFIRAAMPLGQGGTISEDEAQDLACFINAQPRPNYVPKARDFPLTGPPADAVYYVVPPPFAAPVKPSGTPR